MTGSPRAGTEETASVPAVPTAAPTAAPTPASLPGAPTAAPTLASAPAPQGIPLPGNDWSLLDGVTPAEPPWVSVVVVHFEQQAELDRTLAALARQTHPADRLQVIVVDDGSAAAPSVPTGVLLLRQADLGFRASAARNLGAASATGDVLCFLDADTAPEPGYVEALTRLPALAPDVVTVGRRRHADFTDLPSDAPVDRLAPDRELPSPEWLLTAYADSQDLLVSDDRSYRFVIGAVVACSRALFLETGGFDETFTEYGGEDWDWAHRAWSAGGLFAHVEGAIAWHDGPEWAGRADDPGRMARKNAETLALAARIPVAGSRALALRLGSDVVAARPGPALTATENPAAGHPAPLERLPTTDVVANIHSAPSLAALVLCVDTVLHALPEAVVRVPAPFAEALATDARVTPLDRPVSARLTIDIPAAARFDLDELRGSAERLTSESLGSLELVSGEPGHDAVCIARLSAQRAVARETRWGRIDLFPHVTVACTSAPLTDEPDLGAYFGGWG